MLFDMTLGVENDEKQNLNHDKIQIFLFWQFKQHIQELLKADRSLRC